MAAGVAVTARSAWGMLEPVQFRKFSTHSIKVMVLMAHCAEASAEAFAAGAADRGAAG